MAATMLTMSASLVVSPLSQLSIRPMSTSTSASFQRTMGVSSRGRIVCMAGGSSGPAIDKTGNTVADKVEEAQEICAGDNQSEECATAWDAVESATAEKSTKPADPLEEFCEENPEADECRVYKD